MFMFTVRTYFIIAGLLIAGVLPGSGQTVCEPWAATDGRGRNVPGAKECGPPRADRFVGIFYFIWMGTHEQQGPYNITEILKQPAQSRKWGGGGQFHWWDQPRLGYYLSNDEWVIAKHAQLLSDAGVDVVVLDVTNGFTYDEYYLTVCKVYREIRAAGGKTPQIAFLTNSRGKEVTQRIYQDFYQKNLYAEIWFQWKGKPLIMTNPEGLPNEILDFFTIRHSWAWSNPKGWFGNGKDKWPWIDYFPQAYGWHESPDQAEYVPVTVAEHAANGVGRSQRNGRKPPPSEQDPGAGLHFQEQWDRALKIDPEFIFITGWNEWIAQRFIAETPRPFAGGAVKPGETWFVDAYNHEYSRDIEPLNGGFEDNYYYQMVSNIRKFKGVAQECSWHDDLGDTRQRNHPGFASAGPYTNNWGRNDIVSCDVSVNESNLVFSAETSETLTKPKDTTWMNLLIRNPREPGDNWEGFQFRIRPESRTSAVFEQRVSNEWKKIADIKAACSSRKIRLSIPRDVLGKSFQTLEFKWFDNMPEPLDILDFMDHGDTAPNNRFRYVFEK